MNIVFKKVILHNFLSYGHSEIDLSDKGYCLVRGINNYVKDNALSNGSGKSSWTSAICWVLTGQTIQGITQNIQNIYVTEKSCYVKLFFSVDGNQYEVTRQKAPKVDLRIVINGNDVSGKGLRESEAILAQYLPDLTPNLIASIIILGQGLPYKFSDNTPSGRKEVLERLTKSDFMIQDIKDRISVRIDVLSGIKRGYEDRLLSDNSKLNLLTSQLQTLKEKLENLLKPRDFDSKIEELKKNIAELELSIEALKNRIDEARRNSGQLTEGLQKLLGEKSDKEKIENDEFNEFNHEYLDRKYQLGSKIKSLKDRLTEIRNIKDVCPTCGQRIPGIVKPDTSGIETEIGKLEEELNELNSKFKGFSEIHQTTLANIATEFSDRINGIKKNISVQDTTWNSLQSELRTKEQRLLGLRGELSRIEIEKDSHSREIQTVKETIERYLSDIKVLDEDIEKIKKDMDDNNNHLNVLNQMMTLAKRDFRGFLLSNIIDFIDLKAKEYAQIIFNTNELNFILDGNNIDISFCGKNLESLSGGEKQKVNLIIQFAIRDMMGKYLNFGSNILILDEITDNLDALGCSKLLNLISTKLCDVESIFIISHHPDELEIPTDCEMLIVKGPNGVSEVK